MENIEVLILEGDDLEYTAEINENKIIMKYSKSEIWNSLIKGEKNGELIDTGNNIKIKTENLKLKLGYSEFIRLFALMKLKIKFDEDLSDELSIVTKNDKL